MCLYEEQLVSSLLSSHYVCSVLHVLGSGFWIICKASGRAGGAAQAELSTGFGSSAIVVLPLPVPSFCFGLLR